MSQDVLEFNPFLPEVHADPYPQYERLRRLEPVHPGLMPGVWILTRYADCQAVLKDAERFGSDARKGELFQQFRQMQGGTERFFERDEARSMLFLDPPDHDRLRRIVSKAFTARVVEGMRPHIHEIVDGLLDAIEERGPGEFDLVADLAYPLPIVVICEMLGVPPEDQDRFRRWSADVVLSLDPIMDLSVMDKAEAASMALREYFGELVAARRAHPRSDLLTGLIAAEEQGERLNQEELLTTCVLLLVAGHETTVNLISNGVLALLRNRDQWERLRAGVDRPGVLRTAVEELLRYDSPVQFTGRTVLADVEIGGVAIRRGQELVCIVGAANRDPDQFPDPDRLDIGREENRHLAFSGGIHFCLGAPLARTEAQVLFGELVRRLPDLELAGGELEWRETITLRGLKRLPVRFGRSA
jgi:pimeloyl-[acyl-carrier protein] synthase